MKKGVVTIIFLLVGIVITAGIISAQEESRTEQINKAFSCLDEEIRIRSDLTLDEAAFSYLAGVSGNKVLDKINELEDDANCWSHGNCNLRDTAIVAIAKKSNGININEIIGWLENQTIIPSGLLWYLQITIDNSQPASCTIDYSGGSSTVTINDDLKLELNGNSCFTLSRNDYWLKIKDSCLNKTFSVECNGEFEGKFKSNILYQENSGGVVFVSSDTESSDRGGVHTQSVVARCFEENGICNYEGSLWATAVIYQNGGDTERYVPYLLGLKLNNRKYFPEAFLAFILGGDSSDEITSDILNLMNGGHWDITNSPYSAYYDTSLGIIGLTNIEQMSDTLTWLFDVAGQTDEGCWNSNDIADTAFVIYANGWGKGNRRDLSPGGLLPDLGGDGETENNNSPGDITIYDPTQPNDCEAKGYYCGNNYKCITAGGAIYNQYSCLFSEVCCSVEIPDVKSCSELGGFVCRQSESCSSSLVEARDGACCLEACNPSSSGDIETTSSECKRDIDCPSGKTCSSGTCVDDSSGSSLWIWILLLGILILLVIFGIIYRDKLRVWFYNFRGKTKTSQVPPRGPPGNFGRGPVFRPMSLGRPMAPPPRSMPPVGRMTSQATPRDREIEDTLKKLREMSR